MKVIKSNPSKVIKVYIVSPKKLIGILSENYSKIVRVSEVSIMDRYSNGSYIIKDKIVNSYLVASLIGKESVDYEKKETIKFVKRDVSLKEIDDRLQNIDDMIDEMDKK